MKRNAIQVLVGTIAATMICQAQAQTEPLIKLDFKSTDGGWTGFGPTGKVSVTHDAEIVSPGNGALKFGYSVAKGEMNALVFPTPIGSIARAKSIKFRVRTDTSTLVAVMLQEEGGGRYVATCMAPANSWQPIELSTSDFVLAQEKDDPKDPDGKLDIDQVSGIVVTDLSQMFAQTEDANLKALFGIKSGAHALYVEDFIVSADELPTSIALQSGLVDLETFAHPQLAWFGLGGVQVAQATGKPLEGKSLKLDYHQTPGKPAIVSHSFAAGLLEGTHSLTFNVAATQPTKLLVQLEQTDGGKFNTIINVPGGSELKKVDLSYLDFKVAQDSKSASDSISLGKIKTLILLDLSGLVDQADHDNTLWFNQLLAHR